MSKISGAHLVLRCLKAYGIQKLFTIVGDTILPLCDATIDEGMELVDTRHEAAALHMADGWCRVTGQPAVALVTGGPGFANAVSALPNIFTSESPVILLAGCGPLAELGMYSLQEIDQVAMAAPVTKSSQLVPDIRRIPDMINSAFRTALSGRCGPVHLTIPIDLQEQRVAEEDLFRPIASLGYQRDQAFSDPRLVERAVELLRAAQRPVVILGNAARYSASPDKLREFIEATGLPLFTVEQARGLLPDSHPLCFGYGDGTLNDAAKFFREADAVLLLGKRLDYRYGYGRPPFFDAEAVLIQVDPSPVEIGRNRAATLGIAADIGSVISQLAEEAHKQKWRSFSRWIETLVEARKAQRERLEALASDDLPLHPMRVVKEVAGFIREDDVVVIDGGDFVQWGRAYLGASKPGHWLRLGPLAQLGCGLPYALAAKLAKPQARVFLFLGDGSFGFYGMEFDTAVRHDLPIVTIMGNDSAWGIDKNLQLAYYGRSVGTDLLPVRYDQVVEALGGHGEYVERSEEIAPALERALASGKPSLLNIRVRTTPGPPAQATIAARSSQ